MKKECRVCHTAVRVNRMGQVISHRNKYTKMQCKGSFKPSVVGGHTQDELLDYEDNEDLIAETGVSALLTIYLGGVVTGIIAGYFLF